MKKVIGVVLALSLIFTLSGCTDKVATNSEEFAEYFEDIDGFEVFDRGIEDGRYTAVIEADSEDGYDIFFYEYETDYDAKDDFPELVEDMLLYFDGNTKSKSVEVANYERVAYADSEKYSVISRIGNTIVHTINVPKDKQEEVKGYLEVLNY